MWDVGPLGANFGAAPIITNNIAITSSMENDFPPANPRLITLPTINNGDVVIVVMTGRVYTAAVDTCTSANLTFTNYYAVTYIGYIAYAVWSGATLTNEVISVNSSTNNMSTSGKAFSFSGVNTSSIFDAAGVVGTTNFSSPLSLTTTNAADMVIGQFFGGSIDTGYTQFVSGGSYPTVGAYSDTYEYKLVTTTGTYTVSGGSLPTNSALMFAIKSA